MHQFGHDIVLLFFLPQWKIKNFRYVVSATKTAGKKICLYSVTSTRLRLYIFMNTMVHTNQYLCLLQNTNESLL